LLEEELNQHIHLVHQENMLEVVSLKLLEKFKFV